MDGSPSKYSRMDEAFRINLKDLPELSISHGAGRKKVFRSNEEDSSALTQFAWARLENQEFCELHKHPTMDEYFFVHRGRGKYRIGEQLLDIVEGDFIRIPANTSHELSMSKISEGLELIYFGIDTEMVKGT
jgi:mannose-6-phosphate isomerase-like protein (cupin superfamily)